MYDQLSQQDLRAGAEIGAIEAAEIAMGMTLPADYRAFLAFSDGYDGDVGEHFLVLWGTGELPSLATGYEVLPPQRGVLLGSNAGPTAYGYWDGRYISVPFVAAGDVEAEIRVLGDDFDQFLAAIAAGEGW
jgi:SMI1/KNR4 family protein SUKH-1